MNQIKMNEEERNKLLQDFLDKGGKIEKLRPGICKGAGGVTNKRKLQWTKQEVERQTDDIQRGINE